ncbi:hypothetical protein Adeg_2024 [Ammonifex degensii KC4]|uniref:DUF2802 domain-containing protein n=1 Tax=Ammonifex degensii (strain DSM 10501 / KC4) TaxID=429009 RepID=C9R9X3_AMMDK|nr:hypothetical protein [Ammonifex degensii]ACX53102.1 hypothetical protein Adeg_2024 [Ammonifex degensii KC4]
MTLAAGILGFLLGICLAVLAGIIFWRRRQGIFQRVLEELSLEDLDWESRLANLENRIYSLAQTLQEIKEQGRRLEMLLTQKEGRKEGELVELARRWGKTKGEVELMLRLGRLREGRTYDKGHLHSGFGAEPAAGAAGRDGQQPSQSFYARL